MNWKYGLYKNERTTATFVEWDEGERHGYTRCSAFTDKVLVREKDIMFPCGPFFVPTDDIHKDVQVGDLIDCMLIETQDGLMGIGARLCGTKAETAWDGIATNGVWEAIRIPRFMGVVRHWNTEKSFGFIASDHVRAPVFFQKREVLVPYEETGDPYAAASKMAKPGDLVTFDCVETPRGLRGLAIKQWKENGG